MRPGFVSALTGPRGARAPGEHPEGMASQRTQVQRPRGLGVRIGATLLGLVAVYAALVAALVLSGRWGVVVGGVAAVIVVAQVLAADRLVLRGVGAREVTRAQEPELVAIVERLCVLADLPRPRVAVATSGAPNALAVGSLGRRPTVVVERRLLTDLEPAELEGVVAHELAHVAHRDVAVMTAAAFFSLVAALLTKLAIHGGHAFIRGAALVAAPVAWALSTVLLRGLSRARELAADHTAAQLTGRPSALASALLKVDAAVAGLPKEDLRRAQPAAALGFAPLPTRRFGRLLATHPTTERRVAALHAYEVAQQRSRHAG